MRRTSGTDGYVQSLMIAIAAVTASCMTLAMAPPAMAASPFSLFGSARQVVGGTGPNNTAVDLTSNCGAQPFSNTCFNSAAFVFSGVNYAANGGLTVSGLSSLTSDYNVGATDCVGGSPRFVILLGNGDNLVYNFGVNKFGTCYDGWQNTGNATDINSADPRWQINLSNTYSTWAQVVAAEGGQSVTSVFIVQDSGWVTLQGEDTTVDNFTVNNAVMNGDNVH